MIWVDALAVAIIGAAVLIESQRQFGVTLADMLALLAAVPLARVSGAALAESVQLMSAPDNNLALATALMLVLLGGGLLVAAKLVQDVLQLTLDALDSVAGAVFGFVSGAVVASMVLFIILLANPADTEWGQEARKRPAVRQLVYLDGYHAAMKWLRHAGELEPRP